MVSVAGDEPMIVNDEQEVMPPQEAVVVENVPTSPVEPTYRPPCDRDESLKSLEMVEEAVEKNPFSNPSVVEVETYPQLTVNGQAKVARPSDDVAVRVYPPEELPTNILPYDGAVESPVPPYNTPIDDVAETTPALACRGPFTFVLRVSPLVEIPVVEAYGRIEAVVVVDTRYPTYNGKVEVEISRVPSKAISVLAANVDAFVPPLAIGSTPVT